MPKKTALYPLHEKAKAKFVQFGEYDMPVWYRSIKDEHHVVRNEVGIFDINHMGMIQIKGKDRHDYINYILSNDINKIAPGKIQYSFALNEEGKILDDLLVYLDEDSIFMIVNSGQSQMLLEHFKKNIQNYSVEIEDLSEETGLLSIQGPQSFELCEMIFSINPESLEYYSFKKITWKGQEIILSRSGYTGEKGFELFFKNDLNIELWEALTSDEKLSAQACGLGSRDLLRLEMGFPLHGQDLKGFTPVELQKNWCTAYTKDDFIGKAKLIEQKEAGINTKSSAFILNDKGIPRHDYKLFKGGKEIGYVTSGGFSLILNRGIGLCLIDKGEAAIGNHIELDIRGKKIAAEITKIPFVESHVK